MLLHFSVKDIIRVCTEADGQEIALYFKAPVVCYHPSPLLPNSGNNFSIYDNFLSE